MLDTVGMMQHMSRLVLHAVVVVAVYIKVIVFGLTTQRIVQLVGIGVQELIVTVVPPVVLYMLHLTGQGRYKVVHIKIIQAGIFVM
jgi:hypothetical protein